MQESWVVGDRCQRDDGDDMAPIILGFLGFQVRQLIGKASEEILVATSNE